MYIIYMYIFFFSLHNFILFSFWEPSKPFTLGQYKPVVLSPDTFDSLRNQLALWNCPRSKAVSQNNGVCQQKLTEQKQLLVVVALGY